MRLIDADALIAEIVKTTTFVKDSVLFQKMVDEAPTVSADRPIGEWIDCNWSIRCSECGYSMPWAVRNFCPNCGADMRGEEA